MVVILMLLQKGQVEVHAAYLASDFQATVRLQASKRNQIRNVKLETLTAIFTAIEWKHTMTQKYKFVY